MQAGGARSVERRDALRSLLEASLPVVYDYLLYRCRDRSLAEDLTSESYLAAVVAHANRGIEPSTAWLIGIARHKLVDHWRRQARETRLMTALADDSQPMTWEGPIEATRGEEILTRLATAQRQSRANAQRGSGSPGYHLPCP